MSPKNIKSPSRTRPPRRGAGVFIRAFFDRPEAVGAVVPSSVYLAKALCAPFRQRRRPASLLEIGAGTGPVTRVIGRELGPEDRLVVCELNPTLADHLEREVLSLPHLADARREGRIELLTCPIQEIDRTRKFDYIIGGLPFTAFPPDDISTILGVVRSLLRPHGVFSYFEYVAVRKIRRFIATGSSRQRMRAVSQILDEHIESFQIERTTVLRNFPPAHARHCKFHRERVTSPLG
jgi:phospholipid N-methyltransferase